jgi:hypothetical protein
MQPGPVGTLSVLPGRNASVAVFPPVVGQVQGWQPILGGGLNSIDGWVATAPSSLTSFAPFEGDRAGANRGTDSGFPPFTPWGILHRDFAPALDLSPFTKARYRRKYVDMGDGNSVQLRLAFYSSIPSGISSQTSIYTPAQGGAWGLSSEFNLTGGFANFASIVRVEFAIENITGGGFAPPSEIHVDLLEIFFP